MRINNPLTSAFNILNQYQGLIRKNLNRSGLEEEAINRIVDSVNVDRGLYFAINRKYKEGNVPYRQFFDENNIHPDLGKALPGATNIKSDDHLFLHQEETIKSIKKQNTTILSTGTGSGKTEAFLIPILDHCLNAEEDGVKAIVIYPMNALANDQTQRIKRIIDSINSPESSHHLSYGSFIGSTEENKRNKIRNHPPDILITNYVMLDWMLTREKDQSVFEISKKSLKYIVLDEIHTYRGNKATHIKYLLTRLKARFENTIVQIGLSATLNKVDEDSRMSSNPTLDEFINPLLEVDRYQLIEAVYQEEELSSDQISDQFSPPKTDIQLNWSLCGNVDLGLKNLSLLMNRENEYSILDLSSTKKKVYEDLRGHPLVQQIEKELVDKGPLSLFEIIQIVERMLPSDYHLHNAQEIAIAYLSGILFINYIHRDDKVSPILDFRIHLLIKDFGGYLKRCLKCGSFHTGDINFCQECGFPLFIVSCLNINQCLGKISQNRLRWVLKPESTDTKNTYYVAITYDNHKNTIEIDEPILPFNGKVNSQKEEIQINYDPQGKILLQPIYKDDQDLLKDTIPLVSGNKTEKYLAELTMSIIDFETVSQNKKLLAFVDNRELASQYSSIMKDEFTDRFLRSFLRMLMAGVNLSLDKALNLIQINIQSIEDISEREKGIFKEIYLWFWRMVSTPNTIRKIDQIELLLDPSLDLTREERKVLTEVFIPERAIDKSGYLNNLPDGDLIRFQQYLAKTQKGIYYSEGHGSNDPHYQSISLSKSARLYAELVSELGFETIPNIFDRLVEKGVLTEKTTSDEKTHYYIKPTFVQLKPDTLGKQFNDYQELKKRYLLSAEVHSSEISNDKRVSIEQDFKEGKCNLIFATPTLEMGIDIGDLRNVLHVGVPPYPSNYAQRAGRAGRKQNDQNALVLTLCKEQNDHDQYYYFHPRKLMNGHISPPRFDPTNFAVVKQHLWAYLINKDSKNKNSFENFFTELDVDKKRIQRLFGSYAIDYFQQEFKDETYNLLRNSKDVSQYTFYNKSYFPDYCFSRNYVYVVPHEKYHEITDIDNEQSLSDIALSERKPEEAYYKFAPGVILFMAGDVYKLYPPDNFKTIEVNDRLRYRFYPYYYADREKQFATKEKPILKYNCEIWADHDYEYENVKGVLNFSYLPDCEFHFINQGIACPNGEIDKFSDAVSSGFSIGYRENRSALFFRFDSQIINEDIYFSFISVLNQTIKHQFGLDESDLGILTNFILSQDLENEPDERWVNVALYDTHGNKNIPFDKIIDNIYDLFRAAKNKLLNCPDQCEDGCYLCIKSYYSKNINQYVRKESAFMILSYLLGEGKFVPTLPNSHSERDRENRLTLKLTLINSEAIVNSINTGKSYQTSDNASYNTAAFNLLAKVIRSEFEIGMTFLRVITNQPYIASAINDKGSISKGIDAFQRFQFESLRFFQVAAELEE